MSEQISYNRAQSPKNNSSPPTGESSNFINFEVLNNLVLRPIKDFAAKVGNTFVAPWAQVSSAESPRSEEQQDSCKSQDEVSGDVTSESQEPSQDKTDQEPPDSSRQRAQTEVAPQGNKSPPDLADHGGQGQDETRPGNRFRRCSRAILLMVAIFLLLYCCYTGISYLRWRHHCFLYRVLHPWKHSWLVDTFLQWVYEVRLLWRVRRLRASIRSMFKAKTYMGKLRFFRQACGRGRKILRFVRRQSKIRFFRSYALPIVGFISALVLKSDWLSYLLFIEIPFGKSRGHTRRLHISTKGFYLYDVDRSFESAAQLSIASEDLKEAAAQVRNCDGYFADADPRRLGINFASTVAMANRIRIAQNRVAQGSRNPVYHIFLARLSKGTLSASRKKFLDRADAARVSRIYPELKQEMRLDGDAHIHPHQGNDSPAVLSKPQPASLSTDPGAATQPNQDSQVGDQNLATSDSQVSSSHECGDEEEFVDADSEPLESQGTSPVSELTACETFGVDPETGSIGKHPVGRLQLASDVETCEEIIPDLIWADLDSTMKKPYESSMNGKWIVKPRSVQDAAHPNRPRFHYVLLPGAKQRPYYFDTRSPQNLLNGVNARLRQPHPPMSLDNTMNACLASAHSRLVQELGHPRWTPVLTANTLAAYLESLNYKTVRKSQITAAIQPYLDKPGVSVLTGLLKTRIEMFIKDEPYPPGPVKAPRIICARDDAGKAVYGIIFKPINDAFFMLPQCIKHVPFTDRPRYIDGLLGTDPAFTYISIDYSSYESCQDANLMRKLEHKFYHSVLNPQAWTNAALDLLLQPQLLTGMGSLGGKLRLPAIRFSGEMNTSLGNTVNNWLMITTALLYIKADPSKFVCEGDDCLVCVPSDSVDQFLSVITKFGMRLKESRYSRPGDAGFCHQWWDPDHVIFTDVRHRLRQLAYSQSGRDPQGQLNARGLSLYAEYSQCPILGAVARTLIQGDGWFDFKMYAHDRMLVNGLDVEIRGDKTIVKAPRNEKGEIELEPYHPAESTRVAMQRLFGFTVEEQLNIERSLTRDNICELIGL